MKFSYFADNVHFHGLEEITFPIFALYHLSRDINAIHGKYIFNFNTLRVS